MDFLNHIKHIIFKTDKTKQSRKCKWKACFLINFWNITELLSFRADAFCRTEGKLKTPSCSGDGLMCRTGQSRSWYNAGLTAVQWVTDYFWIKPDQDGFITDLVTALNLSNAASGSEPRSLTPNESGQICCWQNSHAAATGDDRAVKLQMFTD